ncbi:hypothetical protein [Azospirillum picis]|uniref:Gasdermin bGSDM n=1 Tax=Azospirillum picis TaxID=488438 RepID=A0ABU0MRE1_9PROT|nr:hypothetical protein [Azospirillum picis]MBP2302205.1 hypothetical protein [Azospirillum picis]MDQ0535784.1 hypothetical protein [Azospirillum picis]
MRCLPGVQDPLLAAMRQRFGLVPVLPPKPGLGVGAVVAVRDGKPVATTQIGSLVQGGVDLSGIVETLPALPGFRDVFSAKLEVGIGAQLLAKCLGWVLPTEAEGRFTAAVKAAGARRIDMSVTHGREQRADFLLLEQAIKAKPVVDSALLDGSVPLYVIDRVWMGKALTVRAFDEHEAKMDAALLAKEIGELSGDLKVITNAENEITFSAEGDGATFGASGFGLVVREGRLVARPRQAIKDTLRGPEDSEQLFDVPLGDEAGLDFTDAGASD